MNLQRLRYLLAVVDTGTVTGASTRLHVAQPAISRQLHALERELGVELFERAGSRLRLSAAGQAFVPLAQDLLAHASRVQLAAGDLAAGTIRQVVVAATSSSARGIIAPFVATMDDSDPLVLVQEVEPARAYALLREGVDLAITTVPATTPWASTVLIRSPLLAYVAPNHHWAGRADSVKLAELVLEPLILLTHEHMTRTVLDRAVAAAGLTYNHVVECHLPPAAQALAAAGRGVAVVSDQPIGHAHAVPLADPQSPHRHLGIVLYAAWDPKHYAASTLESLAHKITHFATALRANGVASGR
ncbi:LysR family transcriptional regulator [Streptomyces sp. NPDC004721]